MPMSEPTTAGSKPAGLAEDDNWPSSVSLLEPATVALAGMAKRDNWQWLVHVLRPTNFSSCWADWRGWLAAAGSSSQYSDIACHTVLFDDATRLEQLQDEDG